MAEHKGRPSRGCLPYFDSPETAQFVTFRLSDSLPQAIAIGLPDCSLPGRIPNEALLVPDEGDQPIVDSAVRFPPSIYWVRRVGVVVGT